MLNLLMCVMQRLRGNVIACKITCYFQETLFAGPVLVTGISIMLLIISHCLSDVFASK